VRIAAGGSTLQYILPPFLETFVSQFPQIDLRLHNVTGKTGLALLRSGEVDLAVGPMLETPPDILFHAIVRFEPMLITKLDHPLASRKRILLKDIARFPLILPPRDQSTYRYVARVFAEHSLQPDVKLEVGGYDVIKTYVKLGLGVSIVMSHCMRGDEQLFTASLHRYFPSRGYGLVLRKGRKLSTATEQFIRVVCPDFRIR
jgi:DNA-binding transcriptional LysR family regulator